MNGQGDTKLVYPGLTGFYTSWNDIAFTAVRVVAGYIIFMHGWAKVKAGAAGVAAFMARNGLEPGLAFAYAAMFLETVGAICIILGLFTRFFAAALAVEMLIGLFAVHWAHGFWYNAKSGGFEYILLIGVVMFAIAIRGGGPYSVDRAIGKEL